MANQRPVSGYLQFRFDPRDPAAVSLTARVAMFAVMLMGLRETGMFLYFGQWAAAGLCVVGAAVLSYWVRRLELSAAVVLACLGPAFIWFAEFRLVHVFVIVAAPAAVYMAWAIRGVEGEERMRLLELKA